MLSNMVKIRDERLYPYTVATEAADMKLDTLRSYQKPTRRIITFSDKEMRAATKGGQPHLVSYGTVIRLAIMARLVKFGVTPEKAWAASLYFTLSHSQRNKRRPAGHLFESGETYLLVPHGEGEARAFNVEKDTPNNWLSEQAKLESAIVIHLNPFLQTVRQRLARALAENKRAA
jgi:hypothetical protein